MSISLETLVSLSLQAKPDESRPEPYYTDDTYKRVALPKAYESSGHRDVDSMLLNSGVTWHYSLEPVDGLGYPVPMYDWSINALSLLPLVMYPDKTNYPHSILHELAHASGRNNPDNTRPTASNRSFRRGVEEAQAEMAAALVLSEFGLITEEQIKATVNYVAVWTQPNDRDYIRALMLGLGNLPNQGETVRRAAAYAKESAQWMLGLVGK